VNTNSDFQGRIALVTGGEFGIGRAIAVRLAELQARVYVADIRPREENREQFAALGITTLNCDVRSDAAVAAVFDHIQQAHGRLDSVVCSAGIELLKSIPDVTEEEWDRLMDTNVKGVFLVCKHAIPALRTSGGGSIVILSSNAGMLPRARDPVYCISKGALIYLMKTVALCHAKDRIRCNAICPGPVEDTGMVLADLAAAPDRAALHRQLIEASPLAQAFGRMNTLAEIADAAIYFLSDAGQMVTGAALTIDGGKSLGVPPV